MKKGFDEAMIGEILTPADAEKERAREEKVRKGFWKTLRKAAAQLPMAEDVVASYYCALDPDTPNHARGILLAALAYFVLPTDFIPDFLAGFGFTDDLAVLSSAIAAIRSNMDEKHVLAAKKALHEDQTDTAQNGH